MGRINYQHKVWYDKSDLKNRIPISSENLNRIEDGIQEAFNEIAYSNLKNLVIQKIHSSCIWVAPKAFKKKFKVFAVGGGGGGGHYSSQSKYVYFGGGGGGGGHVATGEFEIAEGESISVVCGAGGERTKDGGATSFGEYLLAPGGSAGKSGDYLTQICGNGGDGGSGGGGGGLNLNTSGYNNSKTGSGGQGYIFGGGGHGGVANSHTNVYTLGSAGTGGDLGGDGGQLEIIPERVGQIMTDPILNCLFDHSYIKPINPSPNAGYGNGSIGSNGGSSSGTASGGGGGGGYCGNGGDGGNSGGGGGGYCGNGGSSRSVDGYYSISNGGGGGGFFCKGGDGDGSSGGGGGGFFCKGGDGDGLDGYGVGGDGGVLIMYIKDDTDEEE